MNEEKKPGGILLTGGASTRMGFDKASLRVGGVPNARRIAVALLEVTRDAIEVGPGASGLPSVTERPPGSGPLAAVCAGAQALVNNGYWGPMLVVACDMPFISAGALEAIAEFPGAASVVPIAGGSLQPLCARWSPEDLALGRQLLDQGESSMRSLLRAAHFSTFGPRDWPATLAEDIFVDIDTPEDLQAWGLGGK